jgi:aldose 1-epimerase
MSDHPFATVSLHEQDAALEATFVPDAGMLCCSLRHRGQELLAQNAGVDAYAERGKTMGIPLLYPWANRLAAFDYRVAGRDVSVPHDPSRIALDNHGLPIHGVIGARLPWEIATAPDAEPGSLLARLSWSDSHPQLFEAFPFRHELTYEAQLRDARLQIAVTVEACGDEVVPVAFGFHPYLVPSEAARESWLVELPAMRHLALDAQQIPIGPEQELAAERFELSARDYDDGFDSLATPASFAVAAADRRIELELSEGYPYAQVYAPAGGQFICFEPMTAPANALRSGVGLPLLAPGERYTARFSLRVEDAPSAGAETQTPGGAQA